MIARMQNKGRLITGIRIGTSNARRFFPGGTRAIDLELDEDLRIRCDLKASFWRDQPEISDPRLCAWLEAKLLGRKVPASPVPVEVVRIGDHYQLHLLTARERTAGAGAGFGLSA
jgi:hypothetical protein